MIESKKAFAIAETLAIAKKPMKRTTIERESGADEETVLDYLLLLHRYGLANSEKSLWFLTEDGRKAFDNLLQGVMP
jgi:hypothetical protein